MRSGYPKQGSGGFSALPLSDYVDCKSLGVTTNEDITVPAGAHFAMFGGTIDFYAKRGGSAAIPTDVADGSGSILNPYIVAVEPGDIIGLISAAACLVTIAYYGKG
jgi:hypothetical protein